MVGSTPIIWSSKRQTSVQKSTFGAKFAALKNVVEEAVMFRYHLCYIGVKFIKPSPIFFDQISVLLNENIPGNSLNKKIVALGCHFEREHVADDVVEVRKIEKK